MSMNELVPRQGLQAAEPESEARQSAVAAEENSPITIKMQATDHVQALLDLPGLGALGNAILPTRHRKWMYG
jgi:hypothetical protein